MKLHLLSVYLTAPVVSIAAALFFLLAAQCNGGKFSKADPTKYKEVAEEFLFKNSAIGLKIGKVERLDHIGVGGDGGKESYNVYRLYRKNRTAICYITLEKDDKFRWNVTSAILAVDGTEYKLPTKRLEDVKKFKIF